MRRPENLLTDILNAVEKIEQYTKNKENFE